VVVVRRSWLWPFLAFAMVAVAGGALFLVWRTPQQTIFITSSSDSRITARGSDTLVVGPKQIEPVPPPLDAGTKPEPVPRRNPARPPAGPQDRDYERILADRNIAASRCLSTADQIPANATLAIKIDRDGRGVVSIAPDSLAVQPVGACIKSVYAAAKFPRGKGFERQYVLDARELGQQTTGNTTVP
jgi:hypothetical protein